jgi:non-ribosomal peptide synthetase component F
MTYAPSPDIRSREDRTVAEAVAGIGPVELLRETSLNAILYHIGRVELDWPSTPWGKPMANQTAWILNPSLEPCPTYVPGEIHVGGIGLAQGLPPIP